MLLLNHDIKVINDKELTLLLGENTSINPEFRYKNYQRALNDGIVPIPYDIGISVEKEKEKAIVFVVNYKL